MQNTFTHRPTFFHFKKLLQFRGARLLPLMLLISGSAQANYQACLYEVQNDCRDLNGLGAKYAHITWDRPESACMDAEEIQRCGMPPVIVTAPPIDHSPPPINPPVGDVIGLTPDFGHPGYIELTPEQERRLQMARCQSKANDNLKICKDDSAYYRKQERAKCEDANSLTHTLVRVGGRLIRRIPGTKVKGLLQGYEELAPYVGQNCAQNYDDDLLSDLNACEHKEKRELIVCEAVHGK